MPAYLKPIEWPRCSGCGAKGAVELIDSAGASVGSFCAACGRKELSRLNKVLHAAHRALGAAKQRRIPDSG